MRKLAVLFAVFILWLSGCGIRKEYSTAQEISNVERIEIINVKKWYEYNPGDDYEFDLVCEISKENHSAFLKELHKLPCSSYYGSPYDGIMENTIRITYIDGSFELVGERAVYYETVTGEWMYPSYDFEKEPFESFLSFWKQWNG